MVLDAAVAAEPVADAQQGPAVGVEPGGERPLAEELEETLPLLVCQP
jgi:hypothetical protein